MLVKDAIDMLNDHSPDEQIIFAYWTKAYVEEQNEITISDDVWADVIRYQYKLNWSSINDQIDYIIDNAAVEDEDEVEA